MDIVSEVALQRRRVSSLGPPHSPSPRFHGSHSQAHRPVYSHHSSSSSEVILPPIRLTPIEGPDPSPGPCRTHDPVNIDSSHLHPSVPQHDYHRNRLRGTFHTNNHTSSPRLPPPAARLGPAGMDLDDMDATVNSGRPPSSASFASSSNLSNGGSADAPSTPAELLIPLTSPTPRSRNPMSRGRSGSLGLVRSLTSIHHRQSRASGERGRNGGQRSEGGYDSGDEDRSDDGSTGPGSSNTHGDVDTGRYSALGPWRGIGGGLARSQAQSSLQNDTLDPSPEQYQLYAEPTSPTSLATSSNLPPTAGSFRAAPKPPTRGARHAPSPWHTAMPTHSPAPVALTASSSTVANAMQIITTATLPLSLIDLPNFPAEQKPPFTYPVLIRLAIMGSPQRRLLLSQIYAAIEDKFPWYKENASKAWKVCMAFYVFMVVSVNLYPYLQQASIRHCLSLNKEFVRIQRAADDTTHGGGGWWSVDDGATGTPPSRALHSKSRYEFIPHPFGQPGVKRPRKRRNQIPSTDALPQNENQALPLTNFALPEYPSPRLYPQAFPRSHVLGASYEGRHRSSSFAAPSATRVNPYPQHDRSHQSPVLPRRVGSPVPTPISFPPLSSVDHGRPQSGPLVGGDQNLPLPPLRRSLELPPLHLPAGGRNRPNPMRISSLVHDVQGRTSAPAAPTTSK
jgi:hypothetical protein